MNKLLIAVKTSWQVVAGYCLGLSRAKPDRSQQGDVGSKIWQGPTEPGMGSGTGGLSELSLDYKP
jgi:hypothetical protein